MNILSSVPNGNFPQSPQPPQNGQNSNQIPPQFYQFHQNPHQYRPLHPMMHPQMHFFAHQPTTASTISNHSSSTTISLNRSQRCGTCNGCKNKACGMCNYCQDSPQFGGPGVKKQSCIERRCLRVLENRLQRDAPSFKARIGCYNCEDCKMADCHCCLVCLDKKFFGNRYMPGALCAKKRCNNATSLEISLTQQNTGIDRLHSIKRPCNNFEYEMNAKKRSIEMPSNNFHASPPNNNFNNPQFSFMNRIPIEKQFHPSFTNQPIQSIQPVQSVQPVQSIQPIQSIHTIITSTQTSLLMPVTSIPINESHQKNNSDLISQQQHDNYPSINHLNHPNHQNIEPITNLNCPDTDHYPFSLTASSISSSNSPFLNPFSNDNEDSRSSEMAVFHNEEKRMDSNEEFKGFENGNLDDPFLPPSYAPVMKNAVVLQPL